MTTIVWHETVPAVLRLRGEWDARLDAWGVDCVFLRWDWVRIWLRVYARDAHGIRPLVGVVTEDGRTIGIVPFILHEDRAFPGGPVLRCLRMLGDGPLCPDHLVFPVEPGREEGFARALAEALRSRRTEWDRIEIRDLLQDHPAWQALATALRSAGETVVVRTRTHCPYIPLPATFDEYLESVGAKTRKMLRYGLKRIERELSTRVVEPTSIEEVDRGMEHLEELHARAWQVRGRSGVFADPAFRLFHRLHARRAFRGGRLWLTSMATPERPIAVLLGFVSRRGLHYYQLGHDPELRAFSIGTMMVASAIARATERGLPEMDFLRGQGAYKSHLTRHERRGHDLIVHGGSPADHAASAVSGLRGGVRTVLRKTIGKERAQRIKRWIGIREDQ
jgi:CelD/BcsL family acetyltransferase involved in cellulose biosynthesis